MDAKVEVTVQIKVFRNGMMCGLFACRERIGGADSGYSVDSKVFGGLK